MATPSPFKIGDKVIGKDTLKNRDDGYGGIIGVSHDVLDVDTGRYVKVNYRHPSGGMGEAWVRSERFNLAPAAAEPGTFKVGDVVVMRDSPNNRGAHPNLVGKRSAIIDVHPNIAIGDSIKLAEYPHQRYSARRFDLAPPFKVGDIVIMRDVPYNRSFYRAMIGKEYTVSETTHSMLKLEDNAFWYAVERFDLAPEKAASASSFTPIVWERVPEDGKLNVGDRVRFFNDRTVGEVLRPFLNRNGTVQGTDHGGKTVDVLFDGDLTPEKVFFAWRFEKPVLAAPAPATPIVWERVLNGSTLSVGDRVRVVDTSGMFPQNVLKNHEGVLSYVSPDRVIVDVLFDGDIRATRAVYATSLEKAVRDVPAETAPFSPGALVCPCFEGDIDFGGARWGSLAVVKSVQTVNGSVYNDLRWIRNGYDGGQKDGLYDPKNLRLAADKYKSEWLWAYLSKKEALAPVVDPVIEKVPYIVAAWPNGRIVKHKTDSRMYRVIRMNGADVEVTLLNSNDQDFGKVRNTSAENFIDTRIDLPKNTIVGGMVKLRREDLARGYKVRPGSHGRIKGFELASGKLFYTVAWIGYDGAGPDVVPATDVDPALGRMFVDISDIVEVTAENSELPFGAKAVVGGVNVKTRQIYVTWIDVKAKNAENGWHDYADFDNVIDTQIEGNDLLTITGPDDEDETTSEDDNATNDAYVLDTADVCYGPFTSADAAFAFAKNGISCTGVVSRLLPPTPVDD